MKGYLDYGDPRPLKACQETWLPSLVYPEGPCTQVLGTWVLGNSNYSIGFG